VRVSSSSETVDIVNLESGSSVRAVERALQLVEVFARSREPLSITDLARMLDLAPSTVHRLVQTLMTLGYIVQYAESKRYGVGRGIAEVARSMILKYEFTEYARPHLEALSQESGETASLAGVYGTNVIYLDQVEPQNVVRVSNGIGTLAPLHCTALGKIFLADFSADTLEGLLGHAGLPKRTERTITSRKLLERELKRVRAQGYAVDDEEFALGARCVAVGLRGSSGAVVAAVGLSGPSSRVTMDRVPDIARLVQDAAERFARELRKP
jgi:DNA-binding IclR family transcriptional regulator